MKDGTIKNVPYVMHIPRLIRNLISMGTMDASITCTGDRNSCKLILRSMGIAKGEQYGKLWELLGSTMISDENYITDPVEDDISML